MEYLTRTGAVRLVVDDTLRLLRKQKAPGFEKLSAHLFWFTWRKGDGSWDHHMWRVREYELLGDEFISRIGYSDILNTADRARFVVLMDALIHKLSKMKREDGIELKEHLREKGVFPHWRGLAHPMLGLSHTFEAIFPGE